MDDGCSCAETRVEFVLNFVYSVTVTPLTAVNLFARCLCRILLHGAIGNSDAPKPMDQFEHTRLDIASGSVCRS